MNLNVIAIASTPEKLEVAKGLGADHVFLSGAENLRNLILEVTNKRGVDIYLSVTGGHGFEDRATTFMNALGRVMVIGNASREPASINPTVLMKKNVSVIGVWLTPLLQIPEVVQEATAFMTPLLASGTVKPIVGQVFKLSDAGKAFEHVFSRASTGKVIIEP